MSEFQERRAAAAAAAAELPPVEVKAPTPLPAPAPVVAKASPPAIKAVASAPAPEPRFKVGQTVTIKKGNVKAVITKASSVPGKRQTRIECQTADGSIQEYWFDEIR